MNFVTSIFGFPVAAKWATLDKVATAVWLMIVSPILCFFGVCGSQAIAQEPTTSEAKVLLRRSEQDLSEVHRSLSRRIEVELAELRALESELELQGQAKTPAQDRIALAESVQVLKGQLAEVQNLKRRIRDTLKIEDPDLSAVESPTGQLKQADENTALANRRQSINTKATDSGTAKTAGPNLQPGLLLLLKLNCGCMGELHLHHDASGPRFCLHHRHRNGKMTTQTIGRVTGGVPVNRNLKATLPDGSGVYQDPRGNYWIQQ